MLDLNSSESVVELVEGGLVFSCSDDLSIRLLIRTLFSCKFSLLLQR